MYLYTKNTKDRPVFFSQKHYISYQKHLNPSNYKTCLYNLFVYLYTKNTKDRPVFFHKNTTFQKSSCVLTKHCVFSQKHYISYQKHLNPSNYKTCLYNLFVYHIHKKIPKTVLCFFTKTLHFKNPHVFSQNTFFTNILSYIRVSNKICFISKKILLCFSQNTFFTNNLSYIRVSIENVFFHKTLFFTIIMS